MSHDRDRIKEQTFESTGRPLAEGLPPSPLLVAKNQPDCYLRLDLGPVGAEKLSTMLLAGREWSVYKSGTLGLAIYSTSYKGGGTYFLGLQTPAAATAAAQTMCQQQLEAVIGSFKILDE